LKDVSECIFVPALDLGFEEFELLLKLKHFCTIWLREGGPCRSDEVFESGVGEPKCFEAKWSLSDTTQSLPLEGDRLMIRA